MINKSYLIEGKIENLKNNVSLFYGENLGLIHDFKEEIKTKHNNILKFSQEEILSEKSSFHSDLQTDSLFDSKKTFFIDNCNDKILHIIEDIIPQLDKNKVFLFSSNLEKKSKLRKFFETNKNVNVVPCYKDNNLSLRKLLLDNLKNYNGLNSLAINLILEICNNDRAKLRNEINKIKIFFSKRIINFNQLAKLLNFSEQDDFNYLRDAALNGNKENTNSLLGDTIFDDNKSAYYLSAINYRLGKLKELNEMNNKKLEIAVNELKPPIFWQDKPNFLRQASKWNLKKITNALNITYKAEINVKTNAQLNKNLIIKKVILDICNLANAA